MTTSEELKDFSTLNEFTSGYLAKFRYCCHQFQKLFDEYSEFAPQPSEFDRIFQFHRLVLVANVDLNVNSAEIAQLKECGLRLGLRPTAVENVLTEMKKHENGMVPADVMLKIFQVYHN